MEPLSSIDTTYCSQFLSFLANSTGPQSVCNISNNVGGKHHGVLMQIDDVVAHRSGAGKQADRLAEKKGFPDLCRFQPVQDFQQGALAGAVDARQYVSAHKIDHQRFDIDPMPLAKALLQTMNRQ